MDSFGASVHQIAMATQDIFAAAHALADRGFDPLPIPENYYDDLNARFDLPPGCWTACARRTCSTTGSAARTLSRCIRVPCGGLYVEIVQRGPGYHRFGEANASFRIAAQTRLGRPKGMPRT